MPSFLQKIGDFVPTTWALKAAEKVLNGSSLIAVSKELLIMLLFAVVFFLMASWRKADIAK
jgi:ABC-2 type transport system permease protein